MLEGTNTLVGIVSYGTAVCAVNVPDVYTSNLTNFLTKFVSFENHYCCLLNIFIFN